MRVVRLVTVVGVARGLPDLTVGLLEQLLGVLGVAVHVPVIGALGGLKIAIGLMGEPFGLGEVGVVAPQIAIVVLREGKASGDAGQGDKGSPGELTTIHAIASVGHKVSEADEMRYGCAKVRVAKKRLAKVRDEPSFQLSGSGGQFVHRCRNAPSTN